MANSASNSLFFNLNFDLRAQRDLLAKDFAAGGAFDAYARGNESANILRGSFSFVASLTHALAHIGPNSRYIPVQLFDMRINAENIIRLSGKTCLFFRQSSVQVNSLNHIDR